MGSGYHGLSGAFLFAVLAALAALAGAGCTSVGDDAASGSASSEQTTTPTSTSTSTSVDAAEETGVSGNTGDEVSEPEPDAIPVHEIAPELTADVELLQGPPPPAGYRALLPTHNRLDADRINLVFDPEPDVGVDPELLDPLLSWGGSPQLPSSDMQSTGYGASPVLFGLFAIEPFRSNPHLFNLWVVDDATIERNEFGSIPDGTFPDMVTITMGAGDGRASAQTSQFATIGGAKPENDVQFRDILDYRKGHIGSLLLYGNADNFATEGSTLAHELGHALFGIYDEYYGDSGEANPEFVSRGEWPNCATSREQAEEWWGDLAGTYDPMIDVWIEESERLGIEFSDAEIETFRREGTVDLDDGYGGCYGREGYYRPTFRGLMTIGGEPPAFGPVNRRWAERILASYSGEIPGASQP